MKKLITEIARSQLHPGANFLEENDLIVFMAASGELKATYNRCKHRAGRFIRSFGKLVTCPNHGWCLDLSAMKYVEPYGELYQTELVVEPGQNGLVLIWEDLPPLPWESEPDEASNLVKGEYTVRFYTHATIEIQAGDKTLFCDPWLVGPSATRGWWLTHVPPDDWLDNLASSSAVYISHTHSDHLNPPTLRLLVARNPSIPIFYPRFSDPMGGRLLRQLGFTNIISCNFNAWYPFGNNGRFMLFEDATGKDDSALLFEYKGHKILNAVDASASLNQTRLPKNIDLLLAPFAAGANGHPVCWQELYSEEKINRRVNQNLATEARHVLGLVDKTRPAVFVPFAGYFTVAHPADHEIKRLNRKNSPEKMCQLVEKEHPEIKCWIPRSGEVFDLARQEVTSSTPDTASLPDYKFEEFVAEFDEALNFEPLQNLEGIKKYFDWAGYKGDLILQIIETDENFEEPLRDYLLNFQTPELFIQQRPATPHSFLRMKVRASVFRHILKNCLPWEEISVGFQARFYCEPDIYRYDFWHHFQFELPAAPVNYFNPAGPANIVSG